MSTENIPLVPVEEVITGRHGKRTKGQKYGKYVKAIQPYVQWIKDSIEHSKDDTIRMKIKDLAKELGKEFDKLQDTSIYWGLKYALFAEGIVVDQTTHKDNSKILVMRLANEEDTLPPSLSKYLEPATSLETEIETPPEEDED